MYAKLKNNGSEDSEPQLGTLCWPSVGPNFTVTPVEVGKRALFLNSPPVLQVNVQFCGTSAKVHVSFFKDF